MSYWSHEGEVTVEDKVLSQLGVIAIIKVAHLSAIGPFGVVEGSLTHLHEGTSPPWEIIGSAVVGTHVGILEITISYEIRRGSALSHQRYVVDCQSPVVCCSYSQEGKCVLVGQ